MAFNSCNILLQNISILLKMLFVLVHSKNLIEIFFGNIIVPSFRPLVSGTLEIENLDICENRNCLEVDSRKFDTVNIFFEIFRFHKTIIMFQCKSM